MWQLVLHYTRLPSATTLVGELFDSPIIPTVMTTLALVRSQKAALPSWYPRWQGLADKTLGELKCYFISFCKPLLKELKIEYPRMNY